MKNSSDGWRIRDKMKRFLLLTILFSSIFTLPAETIFMKAGSKTTTQFPSLTKTTILVQMKQF